MKTLLTILVIWGIYSTTKMARRAIKTKTSFFNSEMNLFDFLGSSILFGIILQILFIIIIKYLP